MKGHAFLFHAVALARNRIGDFEILVTGDGSPTYRDELLKVASSLKLTDRIQFMGNIDDVPKFLRSCDIVVVPSRCDPLPRTVLEAMACGSAIIASRVGGIPEMIADGKNGILVEFGDNQALANALCRLASDPGLRRVIGSEAQRTARHEFSVQRYQESLVSIVEELYHRETA